MRSRGGDGGVFRENKTVLKNNIVHPSRSIKRALDSLGSWGAGACHCWYALPQPCGAYWCPPGGAPLGGGRGGGRSTLSLNTITIRRSATEASCTYCGGPAGGPAL